MRKFFRKLFPSEDELVGHWETTNEGGFQMLGGSKLDLDADGTGSLVSWGHGQDEPFESSEKIVWGRVDKNTIRIKLGNERDFTPVTYVLEKYQDPYSSRYDKLYDPNYNLRHLNMQGIWNIPGELYRRR